ncbi:alpha/beta hydrolase [Bacillus inaquosorum]|uniref:alpha/beta fold hydrolase n=1 Tax=Bacillus inaquosorum TaxID=483913 RepID=UPI000E73FF97|nr:alpha/beta hydrolase [Bacillus inaquosorum]RKQ22027.1 alpha/beta hydrolase [Bacillus subtilis]MCY7749453.1 alpha/beta hydrolase [Bacillus inaquosorum]MCY7756043.1 alpha/beta hydrolase [Bacillus inaquosorum]MCY7929358.1 alpha/beta hydrolase [Bacillus inaquosorum]MCY7941782.1 alpha/beta hydrolase [Bacillus inaquosorum]
MTQDSMQLAAAESGLRFYQAYDQSLSLWPIESEAFYVSTRFGKTHIIASGPKDAPSLVLLHGGLFSSAMWYPNIAAWSSHYRTYAVDIIGDKNKSIPSAPLDNRVDCAVWLKDVLDSLGLQTAHLAGLSLGGSHIVNFLLQAPERVERAVVMSPAEAFISFHPDVYKYAAGLTGARGAEAYIKWITDSRYDLHPLLQKQIVAGVDWQDEQRSLKPTENGFPYVFTDRELKSIAVPILLMFGEHEVMYHQQMALERASVLVPGIQAEIVKNAGHLLSLEQAEYVNQRVLSFLSEE